jgi:hypothetical protein
VGEAIRGARGGRGAEIPNTQGRLVPEFSEERCLNLLLARSAVWGRDGGIRFLGPGLCDERDISAVRTSEFEALAGRWNFEVYI